MKFYFLGIGGVSMSALAVMFARSGHEVCGSDETDGQGVQIVKSEGIEVDFDVNEKHILGCDIVVFSSAIKDDDERMKIARKYNKKLLSRGEILGKIASEYKNVIAVAGSHGKTTTTALIFEILSAAGLNPTLHLGGYRCEDDLNYHIGEKDFFVTEACEYHNNFLFLRPKIAVVTNVESEHLDFFGTFSNELRAFKRFEEQSEYVIKDFEGLKATDVRHDENGGLIFTLRCEKYAKGGTKKQKRVKNSEKITKKLQKNEENSKISVKSQNIMNVHMHICEEVNKENVMYAYLVAKKLGISDEIIKTALENFRGVRTRFERKKCPFFDVCICDYAHHPTEIEKAVQSAKKIFEGKELIVVFQPHTYSRTKNLLNDFLTVFENVDKVVIFKTYSARESPEEGISGEELAKIMQKRGKNAVYFENFADLQEYLTVFSKTETALLFVGAGDLPQIAHKNKFFE